MTYRTIKTRARTTAPRNTPARAMLLAVALALPTHGWAQDDRAGLTTSQQVKTEISQALEAVGSYAVQERDQALASARAAMSQLDAEIERRQEALRDGWDDMSETTREAARATLRDLQQARNRLGERYGALESGADSAWGELTTGFANAYTQLKGVWAGETEDAPGKSGN